MRRPTNDILAGKEPVAPAEAADVVQGPQKQHSRLRILDSIAPHVEILSLFADVGEELAVWTGAVGAELVENFGERGGRHGDLAEVVEEWNLYSWSVGLPFQGAILGLRCCRWHRSRRGRREACYPRRLHRSRRSGTWTGW